MNAIWIWPTAMVLTGTAALTDARTGKIPNWLTASGLIAACALHAFSGTAGLLLALTGLLCAGFVPAALFFTTAGRALGGGDVKLFAVLGALLGPLAGLELQLLSYCVLLTFALCQLAFRGQLLAVLLNALRLALQRFFPRRISAAPAQLTVMRLGPAIWIACVVVAAYRNFPTLLPWI